MLKTTLGQLLINTALPEEFRDYTRVLDKPGLLQLMRTVAERRPDQYRQIAKALSDVGRDVSYNTGGFSFGLRSLRSSPTARVAIEQLRNKIGQIMASDLPDNEKEHRIVVTVNAEQKAMEKAIYEEALKDRNPLALQVLSGSRGKPMNLKSLLGADLMYVDHRDRPIPIPVLNSYSKGLSPAEYFAGAFGARKGVVDTKTATQEAGYFSKQLNQIAHRLIVTQRDAEGEPVVLRGVPVETDDPDNEGALLAAPVGGYPRNTLLTAKILRDLHSRGVARIAVRSPMAGGPPDGGLYARDLGVREKGDLPPIGDQVGIAAAQAISEPISQGGLSSKHSGGVAGAAKTVSGFKYLNQLVQVPKAFPSGAAHTEVDGRVEHIEDAPAGGKYVTIGGKRHYVAAGFAPLVKPGDEVEAGDVISEGIPNPATVVQHKGVGEGRRYFVKAFRQAMKEAGLSGHRRNLEILARGLINHVRLTDESGPHVPGDIVPYDALEHTYEPRQDAKLAAPTQSVGKYLEQPVLHYTIGTRIRPRMLQDFTDFGVKELHVHDEPPPFEPEMVRGMDNLSHDPDWMTRMLGSNIQKNLLRGVHRGDVSDPLGTSYVPALASQVDFGRVGLVRGYQAKKS